MTPARSRRMERPAPRRAPPAAALGRISAGALLRRLDAARAMFGGDAAGRKLALLGALEGRRLHTAREVERLHEVLCFLRAYPDDARVLRHAEHLLERFAERADLRRHRTALADTGIAGTAIHYRFFWFTALWLAHRWPDALRIDWRAFENASDLRFALPLLVPYAEAAAQDDVDWSPRRWIDRLRGPRTADGTFLVRRFAALPVDPFVREALYERIDPPLCLEPGGSTPARTTAFVAGFPTVFVTRPLDRRRPDLRRAVREAPHAIREVSPRLARMLIDRARESMVTRSRDLDSFEHADPEDVRLVDCGSGLQFAAIGLVPERRALLDAIYGYLTLQNGVPIGYVLTSALYGSALVAYNVFETFRGTEAARNYGKVLAMTHHLFGADTFAIDPYQLGHDNTEGQASGAWWFYYKMGFRPVDREVRRHVRAERAALEADPAHRSSRAVLQRLSAAHLFLHTGRPRTDVLGRLELGNVNLAIADFMAQSFGAEREAGLGECTARARRLLAAGRQAPRHRGEAIAWERWSPLVLLLPGVERWSASEKADLTSVIRAKGGRREVDFVARFDGHRRLRMAVAALARTPPRRRT